MLALFLRREEETNREIQKNKLNALEYYTLIIYVVTSYYILSMSTIYERGGCIRSKKTFLPTSHHDFFFNLKFCIIYNHCHFQNWDTLNNF